MNAHKHKGSWGKILAICVWVVLFLILLFHRDKFTVENIINFSPKNTFLAVCVLLGLYVVKGFTMLINGYILYGAAGIVFSPALSMGVSLAGSVIMITIPYWLGNRGGAKKLEVLTSKYKKLESISNFQKHNEIVFSFLLRVLGVLPCEIVSMYLGACRLNYGKYLLGSLLGLLPSIIAFAVMGEYISDPSSPQFLIAAAIWLVGVCSGLILRYGEKRGVKKLKRHSKVQILTIPNMLSMFRILLIPVIWVLYREEQYFWAAWVIFLSGLTDIIDGRIARKYNMVSDLGKILDPVADKLTQGILILCLSVRHRLMIPLVIVFAICECGKLFMGYFTMRQFGSINSAKWHGKLTTVLLYTVMTLLILFPGISSPAANTMIAICGIVIVASFAMYLRFYVQLWRGENQA